MIPKSAVHRCLVPETAISEAAKRAIVCGAIHNYEIVALDAAPENSIEREISVLTDAVRMFANHPQALGGILEGRTFPPKFDLSGVKISVPMSRASVPEGNFAASTVLRGGAFLHAMLPHANLCTGSFTGVRWTNAVLHKCRMQNARFHGCDFTGCDMTDIDCRDAIFFECTFHRANLFRAVANAQTSFVYPVGLVAAQLRGNPTIIRKPQ